ncbi:MAG: hypothetical protein H6726_02720 [Sandaracinaceae bacterium]|nr:hypothetical protein [Myxococcales bacterium]MCB9656537.1 hypothetical protein [Sandaracinaceae bacterium]
MARSVSRLFHTVVVVGASLSACDGRGGAGPASGSVTAPSVTSSAPEADDGAPVEGSDGTPAAAAQAEPGAGAASASAPPAGNTPSAEAPGADEPARGDGTTAEASRDAVGGDVATDERVAAPTMRARPRPVTTTPDTHASRMDACPPGSERPFPPCYHIL